MYILYTYYIFFSVVYKAHVHIHTHTHTNTHAGRDVRPDDTDSSDPLCTCLATSFPLAVTPVIKPAPPPLIAAIRRSVMMICMEGERPVYMCSGLNHPVASKGSECLLNSKATLLHYACACSITYQHMACSSCFRIKSETCNSNGKTGTFKELHTYKALMHSHLSPAGAQEHTQLSTRVC